MDKTEVIDILQYLKSTKEPQRVCARTHVSKNKKFRSQDSYGKLDRDGFIHRSWMKSSGLPDHVFDGRPVVGICNTWSDLTPCNRHLRDLAQHVKNGVWEAGGLPLEFPAMSIGETQMRPTGMLFRNLLSAIQGGYIRQLTIGGDPEHFEGTEKILDSLLENPGIRQWLEDIEPDLRPEFTDLVKARIRELE